MVSNMHSRFTTLWVIHECETRSSIWMNPISGHTYTRNRPLRLCCCNTSDEYLKWIRVVRRIISSFFRFSHFSLVFLEGIFCFGVTMGVISLLKFKMGGKKLYRYVRKRNKCEFFLATGVSVRHNFMQRHKNSSGRKKRHYYWLFMALSFVSDFFPLNVVFVNSSRSLTEVLFKRTAIELTAVQHSLWYVVSCVHYLVLGGKKTFFV